MSLQVIDSQNEAQPLSRKQETFVAAMLTLPTTEAAARAAGVTGKTAWAWLKDARIQASIAAAHKQALDHALTKLQDSTEESIDFLCKAMRDEDAPLGLRIRAAGILLEKSLEIHVMREIKAELAAIKLLAGGQPPQRRIG